MDKKRVLIVHNYYQIPGGEDTVVANEKQLLEEHGHRVILYSRANAELKTMSKAHKLLLPFSTIFNVKTYRDIKRIIRENDIDIVHIHNTLSLISPSVYYAARACKVPVVQTIHNFRLLCPGATFYRDGRICEDCVSKGLFCAVKHNCYRNSKMQTLACVINTLFHRMTGIYCKINYICLTEFNKKKLLSLKQVKADRVFVKPNFVVSGGELVSDEDRENQFIFAGRIDKLKGIDVLLKAWKLMGDEATKLVICGTGPMEDWCREYISDNRLSNVEMRGFVPNGEVKKIIERSKALILPTQWYEGFPMSIAESFSVGTPVVCSELGNSGDLIVEGVNGAKFQANSPDELVSAITRLMTYENIYKSTLSEYEMKYTKDKNYSDLAHIYTSVM